MNKRAELVQAIQTASTLAQQALAVQALDDYDRQQRLAAQQEREWNAAGAVVEQTLTPVRVHEHHTAATDWMGELETGGENYHTEIVAQASAWYGRVSDMVKADPEELAEQAKGMARRTAGRYGERAAEAAQTFMDYVTYLHSKTAASGLPQIDQLRNPKDDPDETPLPTDVFDNFADEIHPINQGVSGTEDSNRAPLIQEIEQAGGGMGSPEKPNEHSTSMDQSGSYAEVPLGAPGQLPTTAAYDPVSPAIGYLYNMDDFRARQAAQGSGLDFNRAAMRKGAPFAGFEDFEDCKEKNSDKEDPAAYCGEIKHRTEDKKEAASQLPQVQQEVDSFEKPAPTPLPQDVMFPLVPGFGGQGDGTPEEREETKAQASRRAYVAALLAKAPTQLTANDKAEIKDYLSTVAGLTKQADEYTAPHHTPGEETPISNSGETTPPSSNGSYNKGMADGQADRAAGERPSFSDASSAASDYVRGYSQGYAGGQDAPAGTPDVPYSMGGDAGQAQNASDAQNAMPLNMASKTAKRGFKVSAVFVTEGAANNADFMKGYRWAQKWTPKAPMVRQGSAEFESGVYAGITDNPGQQAAWVKAHREAAKKYRAPELMRRISVHERVTRRYARKNPEALVKGFYVHAATSTDLITDGPGTSPDPMGNTPINGPGTPPPMEGGSEPNRSGGPAPYQGAPPYGSGPVAPDPVVGQQQPEAPMNTEQMGAGYSNSQAYTGDPRQQQVAFKTKVQASLAEMRKAS